MAEGREKGFREVPARRGTHLAWRAHRRGRGRKSDRGKPFKGAEGGIFEIALPHRGEAYRVIYALQIAEAIWVIPAFQKKSKTGIKTPQAEVDWVRERVECLKEALK